MPKHSNPRLPSFMRDCEQCSAPFKVLPSRDRVRRQRFCSRACADFVNRTHITIVTHLVEQACQGCGRDFLVAHRKVEQGIGKYCSYRCRDKSVVATDPASRFWTKVNKDGPIPAHAPWLGACWEWTGMRAKHGYGKLTKGGRGQGAVLAHRVAYEIAFGALPAHLGILHKCDNPPCVRNDGAQSHLYAGTQQQNAADMIARNRQAQGARLPQTRIPEEVVAMVRGLAATGSISQREIGRRLLISHSHVSNIVRGKFRRSE